MNFPSSQSEAEEDNLVLGLITLLPRSRKSPLLLQVCVCVCVCVENSCRCGKKMAPNYRSVRRPPRGSHKFVPTIKNTSNVPRRSDHDGREGDNKWGGGGGTLPSENLTFFKGPTFRKRTMCVCTFERNRTFYTPPLVKPEGAMSLFG